MKVNPEVAYQVLGPRITVLVTTVDSDKKINAAPISFVSPIGFSPAIVMISLAPTMHTYQNIKETREFVINILGKDHLEQVLRCGAAYAKGVNELEQVGLRWYSSELVRPPRVKEGKAWIECKFLEERKMGDHLAIFGEVLTAEVSDDVITDGKPDLIKISPIGHMSGNMFAVDFKPVKHKRYD